MNRDKKDAVNAGGMRGKFVYKEASKQTSRLLTVCFTGIALLLAAGLICTITRSTVLAVITIIAFFAGLLYGILQARNIMMSYDADEESVRFSSGMKKRCIPYDKIKSIRMDFTDLKLDHASKVTAAYLNSVDEPDESSAYYFMECLDNAYSLREKFIRELRENGSGSYQAFELENMIISYAANGNGKPPEKRVSTPKHDDTVMKPAVRPAADHTVTDAHEKYDHDGRPDLWSHQWEDHANSPAFAAEVNEMVQNANIRLKMIIELNGGKTVSVVHFADIERQSLLHLLEYITKDEFAKLFLYLRQQIGA